MSEELETRRRRARFRANHRGTKEMDWILGRFADAELAGLDVGDLATFEQLLTEPDPELQAWILAPETCPRETYAALLVAIRGFHSLTD